MIWLPSLTIINILFCIGCFIILLPLIKTPAIGSVTFTGRVVYIVDGDTLYLKNRKESIRLWGINAPESDEVGGRAASRYLYSIAHGKKISCQIMQSSKSHGRIVARCFLPNGRDIGGLLIKQGHAKEMKRYSKGYYSNL